ncbi:putative oxidoreductase [Gordonia polyisoprenivorans NBRC 16320 = JCM 10675]|uniref:Dibenzothiophene monooxygenase n=1 Tax=Gordonia polyisoprenivorans TaxID=84595 RepID=A0A846WX58_9ACTN|nr:acyl-CoA dehydrogenase family protein [Gordonia polyisoprenivorans]NKY05021.1 acyl-CoA dehydrogenase [Gordonia polyisoprenivorans]WCB37631.1 acyl-CoA dehydrogenase family protein [Gordonia polyisoprenivorans]GAB22373.1 putative oxidoreductase [Gordonia polyisoprenivorans NBRC 16320 = JCM 10675]
MTALDIGAHSVAPPSGILTPQGIRTAIAPILARIAESARVREETRDFAFDDVRALADHGVALTGISREEGGAGGSVRDVVEVIIDIARADSNVAQALRGTFLLANQVAGRPDLPFRDVSLARLRSGALFAGTANERNGGAGGSVATTATRTDDGYVINGRKYYSTGGLYASYFSAQARTDDGAVLRFTVPTDRPGVERLDDFDAIGQRLTQSGTTILDGVHVSDDEVALAGAGPDNPSLDNPGPDNPWQGAFAQLYLAAVQAGIAARALDDATWFVREKARPIKHSTAEKSVDDPYVRVTVGEIAARAQAARGVVLLGADAVADVRGRTGDDARRAGAVAAVSVAQAGVVAIESSLRAAELLFDVGGASITDRDLGFDRHWRNARTAANHNPRQWKAAVAGAWHLTGEEPPTTGLF